MTALGQPHRALVTVGSTNDVALAWAKDGAPHGAIVTADAQTAGRGRHGRAWASPPGRHLYLSLVVRLGPGIAVPPLTLAVGVGLCDGLRALGASAAGLKWPNDVLVGGRKLAGVLCESAGDAVVVGIGVNRDGVAAELPPEVAARAITLAEAVGRPVARDQLLAAVLAGLAPWIERYRGGGLDAIGPAWQARMIADLPVITDRVRGRAVGLDRDGALRVQDADGVIHRVLSGQVEWNPPDDGGRDQA